VDNSPSRRGRRRAAPVPLGGGRGGFAAPGAGEQRHKIDNRGAGSSTEDVLNLIFVMSMWVDPLSIG